MKPPLFEYSAPATTAEAIAILTNDPEAMVLAGGQSLVPAMNLRLASPSQLIDLQNIAELRAVTVAADQVRIGAMARHRDVELDDQVHSANPLIREAMGYVAHIPIRNRGTVVGSLCHADAAAEMPLVLLLTGGTVTACGASGEREIAAEDFFKFHMTNGLEPGELVMHASFPALPDSAGYAFEEFARRNGDYAIAAVGVILEMGDGVVSRASIGACGVSSRPVRLSNVEKGLVGSSMTDEDLDAAASSAAEHVTAPDDMHATNAYRKHLLGNLLRRALRTAQTRTSHGGRS